jgi:16S rRNA (uracil1498-N3)-methyltransferase
MKHVRLYQNSPLKMNAIIGLNSDVEHHLIKVLRFPQGQNITLFNGDGFDYQATVLSVKNPCQVQIISRQINQTESCLKLTLAQGIAKGEKMDFLIQKAVELGVSRIVPIFSEHCVVRLKGEKLKKRSQHWRKIIIGACEQSGRAIIPELLEPMSFEAFIASDFGALFVLYHRAEKSLLEFEKTLQATLLIGPEGGLSEFEIKNAIQKNAQPLRLGSRILRTETASLAVLANMQLLWGS